MATIDIRTARLKRLNEKFNDACARYRDAEKAASYHLDTMNAVERETTLLYEAIQRLEADIFDESVVRHE